MIKKIEQSGLSLWLIFAYIKFHGNKLAYGAQPHYRCDRFFPVAGILYRQGTFLAGGFGPAPLIRAGDVPGQVSEVPLIVRIQR